MSEHKVISRCIDILKEFNKLNPKLYEARDHWHYFRYGDGKPVISLYVPRFTSLEELTKHDYEYLIRTLSVLRTIEVINRELKTQSVDIYVSTKASDLPKDFYSYLPSLIIEPTNLNLSVVHKGLMHLKVLLRSRKLQLLSNLWDHEDLLEEIQKIVWRAISVEHPYYPISRGSDVLFRDIFLTGGIIYQLESLRINENNVYLSFKVTLPPETKVDEIIKEFSNKLSQANLVFSSVITEIIKNVARILPKKRIHRIAEETYIEVYKREPEYEWFPFPTVFNELAPSNDEILAIGPYSHIDLTLGKDLKEISHDKNIDEFATYLLAVIRKF